MTTGFAGWARPRRRLWLILGLGLGLQGCTTPEPPRVAPLEVPSAWMTPAGQAPLVADWWSAFGDPVLDRLVAEALERNLDLRQAVARLAEARALASAQRGSALPSLDFGAAGARSRTISPATGKPYDATSHEQLFSAAYEVDLWGRVASLTAAAASDEQATQAARSAVALGVAAQVASAYIGLRQLDAQLDLARRTLVSREKSLALTRARENRGYGSLLETAQAEAELRATAQQIPQIEFAAQRLERALNVVLARAPGAVERGRPLLELMPGQLPDTGLPSALMRRRPDIASAEFQVAAADARLAAQRAQLLPSLNLAASIGAAGSTILQGDPFTVWSLGGSVLAPLFNGGRLRALVEASASRRDQALIGYERTVLTAFSEVETQLAALASQRAQLVQAEAEQLALGRALAIAERRYQTGYASYLDALLAQRNLFAVELQVIGLHAELLTTQIGLYKALGGGWDADAGNSNPRWPLAAAPSASAAAR